MNLSDMNTLENSKLTKFVKQKIIYSIPNLIKQYKKIGVKRLDMLTSNILSKMILYCDKKYYQNDNEQILTDQQYDALKEYTIDKHPETQYMFKGHENINIKVEKNKVTLPYYMASMNKIKSDTKALDIWLNKYQHDVVISAKLDGISAMYHNGKLYTRGNGKVGQDITYLIPYLDISAFKNKREITVRGELIIKKTIFQKKYQHKFSNARNLMGGLTNSKTHNKETLEMLKDVNFVAYQLINPNVKPSVQFKKITDWNIPCVVSQNKKFISNEILSDQLVKWRDNYEYEIDGVIVMQNKIYPHPKENPKHGFAFKMVLSDQQAEATVLDVIYTPSKYGYLKPRVRTTPVNIGGTRIEYCTAHNAGFVRDNKIGIGSVVLMIRSGDVIPKIERVIKSCEEPKLPSEDCYWNENNIELILNKPDENEVVKMKNIQLFFEKMAVVGMGEGNIKRIIKAGYDDVFKIIKMTKEDYLEVDGFKEKMSEKVLRSVQNRLEKCSIVDLMFASNVFGRGMGYKRIFEIMSQYPDVLVDQEDDDVKIERICEMNGFGYKTAATFVNYIEDFLRFLHYAGLVDKLDEIRKMQEQTNDVDQTDQNKQSTQNHYLSNKNVVLTGFRSKSLEEKLMKVGARIKNTVNKLTDLLIVKDMDTKGKKIQKANELNQRGFTIKIMILEDFLNIEM